MKTLNTLSNVILAAAIFCSAQIVAQDLSVPLATISETPEYIKAKAHNETMFQSLRENVPAATRSLISEQTFLDKIEIPESLNSSLVEEEWVKLDLTDDGSALLKIPFDFTFFNSIQNTVWVNANGNLSFDSSIGNFAPEYFPLNVPMLAPFWADLQKSSVYSNSGIYYLMEENSIRILYQNMALYEKDPANTLTFEVILKEKSSKGSGNVAFVYHHISPKLMESLIRNEQKGKPLFISGINTGDLDNHILIQLFDNLIYSFSLSQSNVYGMMNADYYNFEIETKSELVQNIFPH